MAHEDLDGDGTEDLLHDLRTGKSVPVQQLPQHLAVPQRPKGGAKGAKKSAAQRKLERQIREQQVRQLLAQGGQQPPPGQHSPLGHGWKLTLPSVFLKPQ